MRMTRRKRRAYYRLRRRTTINGRAESDSRDMENVGKEKDVSPLICGVRSAQLGCWQNSRTVYSQDGRCPTFRTNESPGLTSPARQLFCNVREN